MRSGGGGGPNSDPRRGVGHGGNQRPGPADRAAPALRTHQRERSQGPVRQGQVSPQARRERPAGRPRLPAGQTQNLGLVPSRKHSRRAAVPRAASSQEPRVGCRCVSSGVGASGRKFLGNSGKPDYLGGAKEKVCWRGRVLEQALKNKELVQGNKKKPLWFVKVSQSHQSLKRRWFCARFNK